MLRYHLDEHLNANIASGLRNKSIDCSTTAEAGLIGAEDEQQLAFATSQIRVLVTNDRDFLRITSSQTAHCGVVYYQRKRHFGQLILDLEVLSDMCEPEEMFGVVMHLQ